MGNPLQDQLLKAGLVSKKQANKVKQEQYAQSRSKKKKKGRPAGRTISKAEIARAAEVARNKEINRRRTEERKQREKQAQIKELISRNRLERDENGHAYHFAVEKKIHRIFVAEEMIDRLSKGQLAVVRLDNCFEVVPVKVARQIAERDQQALVVLREAGAE